MEGSPVGDLVAGKLRAEFEKFQNPPEPTVEPAEEDDRSR